MTDKPPVQYVLVRQDLPVFIQMVNVGHACGEAIQEAPISRQTIIRLLHVENEAELITYAQKLLDKGFFHAIIHEPDAPWNGQAMALATEPSNERLNALGKMLYHLKAAKEEIIEKEEIEMRDCPHCEGTGFDLVLSGLGCLHCGGIGLIQ